MTDCICANKELVASCVHPYCPEHGYDEDNERARQIGEAVIEWCNGFDGDPAECMDRIAATCPGTSDAYFALRMISAALRGKS